jgi:hypothetical protein
MPGPSMTPEIMREALQAYARAGTEIKAASDLGIPRTTFQGRLRAARLWQSSGGQQLADVGYDVSPEDRDLTPEDAWNAGTPEFERTLSGVLHKQWRTVKRPRGPFVLFHQTDPHIDDPGSALKLIEADIKASHDLDAVMCHGGDLLNNWPVAGRLAQKWAEQECTMAGGLLRAQYYIDIFKPDVWVYGNHEEMNPYLKQLLDSLLPRKVLTDYWSVNFIVETPGGRPIRAILSHKFGKGGSWFHKLHGHIREMLEGQEADVLMDGHLHSDGVLDHTLPERNHATVCVASGGYKLADKFSRRISKSSGQIKIRGRAHWIVCDPQAEVDESLCVAFKTPRQAEAYLNGLQNLRAT